MQVATLFRESAKVLGDSMDGSVMDGTKYNCMKPESQLDDGYETCIDITVCGNQVERMLGGGGGGGGGGPANNNLDLNLRHSVMEDHMGHQQQQQHHQQHRSSSSSSMSGMKMEQYGDPYSFVDEPSNNLCLPSNNNNIMMNSHLPPQTKKRGRRKKPDLNVKMDDYGTIVSRNSSSNSGRDNNDAIMDKERKRHDRFNGLSEEEVSQRTLPDHLAPNLDVVIIGINPGLFAAYKGHHYAGPGNHFWKCLYLSGLVPEPLTAEDDCHLLRYGIGFTNMVARPTKGSADLTRREIKQGSQILQEKLQKYRPKVAVFNGKLIYEVFSGKKDFPFGRQSEFVEGTNTYIWVMPSSSARCAQLPRAADKVPFYTALKRFRDYLNGLISELDESEVVFNDTKPMSCSSSKNGDFKNSMIEPNSCSPIDDTEHLGGGSFIPDVVVTNKKKRGRPRKGMEKHPPNSGSSSSASNAKREKLMKKEMLPELNNGNKKNNNSNMDNNMKNKSSDCFDVMDNLKRSSVGVSGGSGDNNNSNNNNNNNGRPMVEIQRKRRGRPKKAKPEDNNSPPSFSTVGNLLGGSRTPDSVLLLETSSSGIIATNNSGTCQPPTASSVSSGYSTATSNGGEERTRNSRDENGSLSNAGSGGPSPSQCYTQSDLSSDICAAISCGSAPPSPLLNGHTQDSVFDGLSSVLHSHQHQSSSGSREDLQNKQSNNNNGQQHQQLQQSSLLLSPSLSSSSSSKLSMSSIQQGGGGGNQRLLSPNSLCGPSSSSSSSSLLLSSSSNLYMNPPSHHHDPSSYMPSYHHHQSFDNRLHSLTSRSQSLYQPSNVRDGTTTDNSMQSSSSNSGNSSSFHGGGGGSQNTSSSYQTTKSFDVASKSLSGLESLVDQIPSIADSDVGSAAAAAAAAAAGSSSSMVAGLLPDTMSHHHHHHHHSQSLSNAAAAAAAAASLSSHSGQSHGGYVNESPGFLPYGPPPPPNHSYANSSHHYAPTYYASELSSAGFPVNSLGPAAAAYCSPSPLFGFPSYGQYPPTHHPGAAASGYSHHSSAAAAAAAAASLHLQSAYGGQGYPPPSAYSTGPNPYNQHHHGNSSSSSSTSPSSTAPGQRFPQRLHLRQDGGMDLGHMGFSGF